MGVKSGIADMPGGNVTSPYMLAPFANPFKERGGPSFPMPDQFDQYRTPVNPEKSMEVQPADTGDGGDDFYSPGYNPYTGKRNEMPNVTPIEGRGMEAYIPPEKEPEETGWKGMIATAIKNELAFPTSFNVVTATDRVSDISGAMGNLPMGIGTLGGLTAIGSEYGKRNMQNVAARAALGQEGYAVGMFENQVVGTKPGTSVVQGIAQPHPVLSSRIREQLSNLENKGGALGSAYTDYQKSGGRFDMSTPLSKEQEAYEKTILDMKIDSSLKAQLLGYNPNIKNPLNISGTIKPNNYYTITPFEQILEDRKTTSDNRAGNVEDGSFTDVSAPSMGLETDIDAQQSQVNPMGINLGIDMDNISGVPTGVQGLNTVSPVSSLTASSAVSPSYYSDNESGDNQTSAGGSSGFGGGGWTAYGGRIQKAYGGGENKGFTSKTPKKITIQGVGLIKPEDTFLKTDTVRDRYDLEARENDFIINGPTSEQFRKPILAFINQAETNLKNKGVDISVGKPTIPVSKQVPLLVASSETYIPKEYIEAFNPSNPEEGYRILEAMNNVGKPEVTRLKSQIDEPTDQGKYQANEGMRIPNPQQGFLFRRPNLNTAGPSINKYEDSFVPGVSDEPVAMSLDQQRYFGDYEFGDIKKAIKRTEIQGFEKYPYIFTGVKAKKGESSSAFGPMQITAKTLQDFKNRSSEYGTLDKDEKKYIEALLIQGEDKINQELYGTLKRGPNRQNVSSRKIYGKKEKGLKPYGRGVINSELHKKYYDKIADRVLMHKLGDHKTIEKALASYGEGANYSQKVLNDLLDIMQGAEPPTKVTSK